MEPVSLAVSIVPLLISAAENYREVYTIAQNFKRYNAHVRRLERGIRSQSLHFEEHRRALLANCLDNDTRLVDEMLGDPRHSQWESSSLKNSMRSALGISFERYCLVVQSIVEELTKLTTRIGRHGQPNMARRFIFSFNNKEYNEDISALRDLLLELASIRLEGYSTSGRLKGREKEQRERLEQNLSDQIESQTPLVRNIPQDVYDALVRACSEHSEHNAQLHLELCQQGDRSVLFELGIRAEWPAPDPQHSTAWLRIVSHNTDLPVGNCHDDPITELVTNLPLANATTPETHAVALTTRTVVAPPDPERQIGQTSVNLCVDGRLCSKLQQAKNGYIPVRIMPRVLGRQQCLQACCV